MTDASWDNGGFGPPVRRGVPAWAKVLLGCGVAAVLLLATCVGGGLYGLSRLSRSMKHQEWAQLRVLTEELQTDAGTRSLYARNPGLAADYPTEASFLAAAESCRPRLEPIPEAMPSLFTGRIAYNVRIRAGEGHRQVELRYRYDSGAWILARWEDGKLVGLSVH